MDYPGGTDCAWLATDSEGNLAAFVTAGLGPIPREVLRGPIDIEALEDRLLELPYVASATLHVELPDPSAFQELSQRGLFVYDWQDIQRVTVEQTNAYELVASPSVRVRLEHLPDALRASVASPGHNALFGAKSIRVTNDPVDC
jgi:hypothetical protein